MHRKVEPPVSPWAHASQHGIMGQPTREVRGDAVEIIVAQDYEEMGLLAAREIARLLDKQPEAAVVVATGATPLGTYRELAALHRRDRLDASRLRVFQLDAYVGVSPDDRRSLYRWLAEIFLKPLGVGDEQVVRLPGDAPDPEAVCREYDAAVEEAGGFDLAVLGLGPNGHLGFNEPPADPRSPTRVVSLTEESIASNAAYWGARVDVPPLAMTAGMRPLLMARRTLLLVSGAHKHDILHRTVEGVPTADVPASYLHQAANVTIFADDAAWTGGDGG
ncbi:MAG: glucosamine-6-phosphate deaminase [Chloroflexia bacterium]